MSTKLGEVAELLETACFSSLGQVTRALKEVRTGAK